jgi:hypothetical protein
MANALINQEEPAIKGPVTLGTRQIRSLLPTKIKCLIQTRQSNNFCRPTSSIRTHTKRRIDNV